MDKTDLYQRGEFTEIVYPFPDEDATDCMMTWRINGYLQRTSVGEQDGYDMEIWSHSPLAGDVDYPYFICSNILDEGRMVFFTNYWDMLHFINNYAAFILIDLSHTITEHLWKIRENQS